MKCTYVAVLYKEVVLGKKTKNAMRFGHPHTGKVGYCHTYGDAYDANGPRDKSNDIPHQAHRIGNGHGSYATHRDRS